MTARSAGAHPRRRVSEFTCGRGPCNGLALPLTGCGRPFAVDGFSSWPYNHACGAVAKQASAADLKSASARIAGSNPARPICCSKQNRNRLPNLESRSLKRSVFRVCRPLNVRARAHSRTLGSYDVLLPEGCLQQGIDGWSLRQYSGLTAAAHADFTVVPLRPVAGTWRFYAGAPAEMTSSAGAQTRGGSAARGQA